jgi:deaminated glutathione amidase
VRRCIARRGYPGGLDGQWIRRHEGEAAPYDARVKLSVALVQLDATDDVDANIERAVALADEAATGSRLVALPEYLQFRGPDAGYRASARSIPGSHTEPFAAVARRRGVWILVGSLAEASDDPMRPYNTSTLIGPDGEIVAAYRKLHLFDVSVDDGPSDLESARVSPGGHVVTAQVEGATLGLSICYDLRFPELYRALALAGAEILTVPSNFTERTGRDHWEVLLRARAIENGAYVLAPSQIGGPRGSPAYGRSMIVDPWGTIVAQAPDSVGIIRADLDLDRVASVRRQIPALANRRPDAYQAAGSTLAT